MDMEKNSEPESQLSETENQPSPCLADWFWHPWYAKLYLSLMIAYWIGLWGTLALPFAQLNTSLVNTMVLLIVVFNPITVAVTLGYGFLKAKIACRDWKIIPAAPSQGPSIDPYSDPFDCRSGDLHLRHIGVMPD